MKIHYKHLLKDIVEKPSINDLSLKLFQLGHEHEINDEICINADIISKNLKENVDHFAYSFGDISSFNQNLYNLAIRKFKFIYTGIRGNNLKINPSDMIFRDEINPNYSNTLIESFLYGLTDFKYKSDAKILSKWIANSK